MCVHEALGCACVRLCADGVFTFDLTDRQLDAALAAFAHNLL